ncbi:DNA topoisomerase 1 [Jannaschia pagri]|uniref:DNA topoisomerase 1 n=1 Tax=Jannaschia pagri TaxID=2829797 RepID=A0ABQ4NKW6_9RHOB|nr:MULTISPECIES: type I DNA topoisomerase [unclassified Jannaschia]GIT91043.1 DNA topoisomerase 1 [Jannaschia sp. AI_61]GIT94875.1 DNA topoisomerase 1 [Jannaschia sp. AI_62]
MPVVVVESPAKAKTINGYLGKDYTVLASYGHVRDLVGKDGSVDPEEGFAMTWEVPSDSKKRIKDIADALADDPNLILATDPDREGEAISWHLQETLRARRGIKKDMPIRRVAFNAITKKAVQDAIANPRDIDTPLVEAYLARRALDYLVGFTLSPVLWRKLPGSRSAGRVQSVSLRLVVEREMEIEAFDPQEYWTVRALLETPRGQTFEARLVGLAGDKVERFTFKDATAAELAVQAVASRDLTVTGVEAKPASRNPSPPFMTSTLQQEASRKFGMGAKAAMGTAQRLYEAGHITYMRTDGIDMAPEAVHAARDAIKDRYGDSYVPDSPRLYKNKAKNAQEAHECIRPTDMAKAADDLRLDGDQKKLYDLIWKRTLASQMSAAKLERTVVTVGSADGQVELRANGQVVVFDGFMKVYTEGRDDDDSSSGDDRRLPAIHQGDAAKRHTNGLRPDYDKLTADAGDALVDDGGAAKNARLSEDGAVLGQQSFTQPPPRYTEATLVKRMEELGIGRPSTYASILGTIVDRGYVEKDGNRLIPKDQGRLVTVFLSNYFRRYVGYDFTAGLEDELDQVSAGDANYKDVLDRFWRDFKAAVDETAELRITDVLEKINEVLEPHLFPEREDGKDRRLCPKCEAGRLSMRTARSGGAFIGCSNYPECRYTRPFGPPGMEGEQSGDERMLGVEPESGLEVWLKSGRFGPYVQLGEATEENKKPKRSSLPKSWTPDIIDFDRAMQLLSLPRLVGTHPEDGQPIETNLGRYGPYVMHKGPDDAKPVYANLPDEEEVFTIGMNRAVEVLADKRANPRGRGRTAAKPLKELGEHPENGGPVNVMEGRYGPYVKWDKINATIPKDTPPEALTMEQAVELIAERAAKSGKKTTRKPAAKKAPAKKPAAKKAPAKKPAAKKPASKTAKAAVAKSEE